MGTISAALRRGNAFDLLRLVAALLVVFGHSWVLTGHTDPLTALSGTDAGAAGVGVFFLLSGYLVAGSWLSDPSPRRFAGRRFLRIYPAYVLVILVLALVLGPLCTQLSLRDYLANPGTWKFLGGNLLIIPMQYDLPGVFAGNPFPGAVDGSLWTIRVEVLCYVAVVVLGLLGALRRRWVLATIAVAACVVATAIEATGYTGPLVPFLLGWDTAVPIAYFALGMAFRAFRGTTPPPWWALAAAAVVWAALWVTPAAVLGSILFIAVATFTVAFRAPAALHQPTKGYDLSYGTYLLGFPVQQILAQAGLLNPWLNALLTAVIVLALAAASWRWVEKPALRHKPVKPVKPAEPVAAVRQNPAAL
ncbi:acyltransferase [Kutzneria viridogrisea]|uniref:Peptidoglycan/LPS O-acetylase OafA/YrhL n=1 Tax=Kutzneria viridogrisea TaxID=47990 RepID=A0ABR6BU62_9PSEU|nr:peptidoglycan/LPS O-acetylase OafA/YrhL [Kutzneria viridogrisea]